MTTPCAECHGRGHRYPWYLLFFPIVCGACEGNGFVSVPEVPGQPDESIRDMVPSSKRGVRRVHGNLLRDDDDDSVLPIVAAAVILSQPQTEADLPVEPSPSADFVSGGGEGGGGGASGSWESSSGSSDSGGSSSGSDSGGGGE